MSDAKGGTDMDTCLEELFANHSYVNDVVQYCEGAYITADKRVCFDPSCPLQNILTLTALESMGVPRKEVFEQGRTYTQDALRAVAEHINVVAANLTHYINLQDDELCKLDNQIVELKDRLAAANASAAARSACLVKPKPRPDQPVKKVQQLEGDALPRCARPLDRFMHEIDFDDAGDDELLASTAAPAAPVEEPEPRAAAPPAKAGGRAPPPALPPARKAKRAPPPPLPPSRGNS